MENMTLYCVHYESRQLSPMGVLPPISCRMKDNMNTTHDTEFGRVAYSTSSHCLFGNMCCLKHHTDSDATKEVKYILQQCTDLLVRYGANLQQIGRVKAHFFKNNTFKLLVVYLSLCVHMSQ
jgi:hypothetical protein